MLSKKFIIFTFIFLNSSFIKTFAYDEQAYQKLKNGEKNLIGADLQNAEICGELKDVNFANANLSGATFKRAYLKNIIFDNSILDNTHFSNGHISDSKFLNSSFKNSEFNKLRFFNTEIRNSIFFKATFKKIDFNNGIFDNDNFNQANFFALGIFKSKILNKTSFKEAVFDNSSTNHWGDINDTEISDSFFDEAKFKKICFFGSSIYKTSLESIKASMLTFHWCAMRDVSFRYSQTQSLIISDPAKVAERLDFSNAHLTKCCFVCDAVSKSKEVTELNFCATYISSSLFLGIHFKNCKCKDCNFGISIFQNVSIEESEFQRDLIRMGAMVNEEYNTSDALFYNKRNVRKFIMDLLKESNLHSIREEVAAEDISKPFFWFW
jgi:uncharacterized protein YjbI with pentapeptide repeats